MRKVTSGQQGTAQYSTYVLEIWIIYFTVDTTTERELTAEQIAAVWNDARFGNVGRILGTVLCYPFTFVSFIRMKRAQTRAWRATG